MLNHFFILVAICYYVWVVNSKKALRSNLHFGQNNSNVTRLLDRKTMTKYCNFVILTMSFYYHLLNEATLKFNDVMIDLTSATNIIKNNNRLPMT